MAGKSRKRHGPAKLSPRERAYTEGEIIPDDPSLEECASAARLVVPEAAAVGFYDDLRIVFADYDALVSFQPHAAGQKGADGLPTIADERRALASLVESLFITADRLDHLLPLASSLEPLVVGRNGDVRRREAVGVLRRLAADYSALAGRVEELKPKKSGRPSRSVAAYTLWTGVTSAIKKRVRQRMEARKIKEAAVAIYYLKAPALKDKPFPPKKPAQK